MILKGFAGLKDKELREFEKNIGFELPQDYQEFLLKYNGGVINDNKNSFKIKELQEITTLDILFGLNLQNTDLDLKNLHKEYASDLLQNMLVIGSDSFGTMIVLLNQKDDKGIYYWDYSWEYEQSDEEKNGYKIAGSFQEFMDNLKSYNEVDKKNIENLTKAEIINNISAEKDITSIWAFSPDGKSLQEINRKVHARFTNQGNFSK